MSMKQEITSLKRENTRLANANVKLNKCISTLTTEAAAGSDWEKRWGEARSELSDVIRAKNKLVEEKSSLERTVSGQGQEIRNHEALLRDMQRDMKTVCEAIYGQDFNPEWMGDRPLHIYQDGLEYAPINQNGVTVGPAEHCYVEPIQRLLRMLWRRTHWGLNPLMDIDRIYGESPR
ncbi:unnamed protein product [marine sediment metagenome]|uniref:Uncharacterized protein n=1 Tax=marine sediment metagenome TaxID=412755 RepID=X0YHG6_9ZZZZ